MLRTLSTREFLLSFLTDAAIVSGSSRLSVVLQAMGFDSLAGIALGLSAPLPTYVALKAAERQIARQVSEETARQEMKEHPVEKALMPASLSSFFLTSLLGFIGQLKNPLAVNFSTEMAEPVFAIVYTLAQLRKEREKYRQTFTKDPVTIFRRMVSK